MPVSDEYVAHIRDLLSAFEPLRIKRMFGGAGIYSGDLSFAILVDDALYLKADDSTRGDYESRGLHPFTYRMRNGRTASMSYYPVPPEAIDDPESLSAWAAKALDAARRAATSDDLISAPRSFVSTQGKDMTDQWEGWRGGDFADSAMALGPDFARILLALGLFHRRNPRRFR
jgi:DNA transformation protein